MADAEKQETEAQEAQEELKGGTVMQCGATDYWAIGRTKDVRDGYPNLQVPHRLKALEVGSLLLCVRNDNAGLLTLSILFVWCCRMLCLDYMTSFTGYQSSVCRCW